MPAYVIEELCSHHAAKLEALARELKILIDCAAETAEDEIARLTAVYERTCILLATQQKDGLAMMQSFAHNVALCIGAHQTKYYGDVESLVLYNQRLFQQVLNQIAVSETAMASS
jgi:hypothetical protein